MDEAEFGDLSNTVVSFPVKLFALLEQEGEEMELIQWVSHGLCFRILNPDRFAAEIVPKYFKQTKLTSFQRQLNLYGFRRIAKGPDQGCYFHPKFQYNRRDLLHEVKRLPEKGSLPSYDEFITSMSTLPIEPIAAKSRKRSFQDSTMQGSNKRFEANNQISPSFNTMYPYSIVQPGLDKRSPAHLPPNATSFTVQQQKGFPGGVKHPTSATNAVLPQVSRTMSKLTMNIGYGRNVYPSNNPIFPGGSTFSDINHYNSSSDSSDQQEIAIGKYLRPAANTFSVENAISSDVFARDISCFDEDNFTDAEMMELMSTQIISSQSSIADMYHDNDINADDELDMLDFFAEDLTQSMHATPTGSLSPAH